MNTTVTNTVKSCFNFLYDDKLGIINQIIEAEGLLIQPFFHYYVTKEGIKNTLYSGSGSSQDKNVALSKAIGECIERYCLSFYQYKNFVYTTCDNLSNQYNCVSPEKVKIYTTEELKNFHFQCYTTSFSTFFCVGFNVSSGSYQYIPLSLVYLKSSFWTNHANSLNIIQQTISTGAAFGDNFYQTALSGIYETIERDAMISFWLLGKKTVSIDIESLTESQKNIIKTLNYNDITFYLLDISVEKGVFVILTCICSDNAKLPSMVFSAAAHHNIDEAIQKSIEESIGTFEMACVLRNKKPNIDPNLLFEKNWDSLITDRDDHVLFWSYKETFEKFSSNLDFVFSSKKKKSRSSLKKQEKKYLSEKDAFDSIVKICSLRGYDTIIIDISTADITSLGLMVLKTIIPGYLPLQLGYRFKYSSPERLIRIAQEKHNLDLCNIQLNYLPHPFP